MADTAPNRDDQGADTPNAKRRKSRVPNQLTRLKSNQGMTDKHQASSLRNSRVQTPIQPKLTTTFLPLPASSL